jgi:hypothetical protein
MRGVLNTVVRLLCAAIALLWVAGVFIAFIPRLGWVGAEWVRLEIQSLYIGTAVWAYWPFRRAGTRVRRLLFLSIMVVAALVLATDALARLRPPLAALLHHPIGTVLGYSFGALVVVGLLLEAHDWPRRNLEKKVS